KTRRINGRRLCWGDRDQPQRVACNHRIRIQAPVSALIFFAMKGFYKAHPTLNPQRPRACIQADMGAGS
ncbi:MAG TPA: hypothetical protein VG347_24510, partial [Verrucomicrobiae bacterium]|nr:hypothetical protein [Verrucomicrobiae bacterium]